MSEFPRYVVTLNIVVTDKKAAIGAARRQCRLEKLPDDTINTLSDAVNFLLDPGSLFESGIEIEESGIEKVSNL